jgi:hypothetical protein
MQRSNLLAALAGALGATALTGGIAWAAIPDDDGVIHGCHTKLGGVLRVIDTAKGQRCLTSVEVPLTWNEQGPKGDRGATGADGAPGRDGSDGEPGHDGTDGVSVLSQVEPPGNNCASGGTKFTAVDGATYVCHGTSSAAPSLNGSACEIPGWFGDVHGTSAVQSDGDVSCGAGQLTVEISEGAVKVWALNSPELPATFTTPGHVCPTSGPTPARTCGTFVNDNDTLQLHARGSRNGVDVPVAWMGCSDVADYDAAGATCTVTTSTAGAATVTVELRTP